MFATKPLYHNYCTLGCILSDGNKKRKFFFRYGDKAPKTITGKLLGLVWMLAGLIITTMFISIITTSMTSVSLEGRTNLRGVTVSRGLERANQNRGKFDSGGFYGLHTFKTLLVAANIILHLH